MLLFDFVVELAAGPPLSPAAAWSLAVIAAVALATVCGIVWRASQSPEPVATEAAADASNSNEAEAKSGKEGAFRDPWFAAPTTAAAFILLARQTLKEAEEGDVLRLFAIFLAGGVVTVVVITFLALRKKAKAKESFSAEGGRVSVGVTGEDRGTPASPRATP